MKRRELLLTGGAALLGTAVFPFGRALAAAPKKPRKILYFTRCAGFEHSVVHRNAGKLSYSEEWLVDFCKRLNCEVVCSKDGRVFDGDLSSYDAFVFYTSGDLLQPVQGRDEPAMTKEGYKKLLDAVASGKGFFGFHSATDTFRTPGDGISPFTAMIGGEFIVHGQQQKAPMKVVSPDFPGLKGAGESFEWLEEWYTIKKFAKDMHVILVQDTTHMKNDCYQRPSYPATWARMHGKGRVYYTSLGHREDIWTKPIFKNLVEGGLNWCTGVVDADVTPNLARVAPKAEQLKR